MLLSRDKLLQNANLKQEKVEIGNGDVVYVREMTAKEREDWERSWMEQSIVDGAVKIDYNWDHYRAKLAVNTICDEKGKLILKSDDYKALSESISYKILDKIVSVARNLNALEKEKDNIVKNLEADMVGDSNSGSAKT